MMEGKSRREDREGVPAGLLRCEFGAPLVVDDALRPELRQQRKGALPADAVSQDRRRQGDPGAKKFWNNKGHRSADLQRAQPRKGKD